MDLIAAVREAVGPEIELLIDCHGLYDVPTAVRLAHRLAPYAITWFEEPVAPQAYRALATVRGQIPTRICVGERLHTRYEFLPIFARGTGGLHHARCDLDRRHQRTEEDRHDGRGVRHPDLAPRRQRPDEHPRGRARRR